MTETELKQRLSADVDSVEAPSDLLDRARAGGARRLRRRRFLAAGAIALTTVVVGGVAVTAPAVLDHRSDPPVASRPGEGDPYAFLMNGPTRGDLAGDTAYLRQVLEAWRSSHGRSINHDRGIFNHMQGDAKVAWAGNTPGGRAAIVVENSDLRNHSDVQLYHEGVAALVGYVGDGKDGKPTVLGDDYPVPGASQQTAFVVEKDGTKALVALQMPGKPIGLSLGRTYAEDGSVKRTYNQLTFRDRVAIVKLPAGQKVDDLKINRMPGTAFSSLSVLYTGPAMTETPENRLWSDFAQESDGLWPMSDGANKLRSKANELFNDAIGKVSDPNANSTAFSIWTGYGVTTNGTAVYLGEQALDNDPTHLYAVLKPKTGNLRIVGGGVPDAATALPVAIKLPDNQGWAVARKDAQLSYRYDGGTWSPARSNALLVPAGSRAEVKVEAGGTTDVVPLS
ncbi:hypothetical protein [Kribbella jiaozuonensis]|uniref:Uncharacterized protein n=1 Tax=Kribbella jiaozuonensis TaxID=2575441 RepID=A0A4U3LQ45_9ACTN|nr:hypothetical protein [Kribbella jiaozuonensis]TKK77995.1 hypothetical protein FDA38_23100 [Kribbella jiaozuonensis]